jgi:hypothetical protein
LLSSKTWLYLTSIILLFLLSINLLWSRLQPQA